MVAGVIALGTALGAAVLLLLPELTGPGHNLIYVPAPGPERWLVAALALAGAGTALVAALRGAGGFAVTLRLAAALLAVLALEAATYPARYAHWYDVRSFVERVRKERPAGGVVLAYPDANLAFDFYLRGAVQEMARTEDGAGAGAAASRRRASCSFARRAGPRSRPERILRGGKWLRVPWPAGACCWSATDTDLDTSP